MQTVTLGRTGLEVSVVALGAGGHSRLGLRGGASEAEAANLVRAAIDRGVTIIDTAPVYGTEDVIGMGLEGRRDGIVVSSKVRVNVAGSSNESSDFVALADIRASVETSLRKLRTDRLDILHLHGVRPQQYDYAVNTLLPELQRLQAEGKVRFLGITEGFGVDVEHAMLRRAIADGVWDVLMLGYNFVNPSAARHVLPEAEARNLGTMAMYAVRGALSNSDSLGRLIERLAAQGEVDLTVPFAKDAAGLLLADGVAGSLTEAAYRFCRHSKGIHVVMTGTGNLAHLEQNIAAINGPALPAETLQHLSDIFGRVKTATGDPEKPT